MANFCIKCGEKLKPTAKFCTGCGIEIPGSRGIGNGESSDAASAGAPIPAGSSLPTQSEVVHEAAESAGSIPVSQPSEPVAHSAGSDDEPKEAKNAFNWQKLLAIGFLVLLLVGGYFLVRGNSNSQADNETSESSIAFDPASYKDQYVSQTDDQVTVASEARLRDYPTTKGTEVLRALQAGETLTGRWVKGVDPSTRWFRTTMDGDNVGYVWDGNLRLGTTNQDAATANLTTDFVRNRFMFARSLVDNRAIDEVSDGLYIGSPAHVIFSVNYNNGIVGSEMKCVVSGAGTQPLEAKWSLPYANGDTWCQFPGVPRGNYELSFYVNDIVTATSNFEVR